MDISKQTMSVEGYTRYFVKKIVKDEKYREVSDLQSAGYEFYTLLQRFAQEGDREDVRTPFKIMKDEFMNEWKNSNSSTKDELIRRLFGILDVVHEECQQSVQHRINGTEVSYTILEELRLRLMKMVVGDTWKEALPLRIEALKHMHRYRNRELECSLGHHSHKSTLKHRARHITVKKLKRSVVGHSTSSWTAVFNDLLLTSGSRLAPLLFAILNENQIMEERLLNCLQSKPTERATFLPANRASCKSVQSNSSSTGSASGRVIPTSDGEKEAPQYYTSLNSDLNAKLQLLKQRGLVEGVSRVKDNTSEDSGGLYTRSSRYNDEEINTPRSEDNGVASSILSRSFTPFSDEAPPPWSQHDPSPNPLPDGALSDGELTSSMEAVLKLDASDHPPMLLPQSASAKIYKNENQDRTIKKSASCQATGFSLVPPKIPSVGDGGQVENPFESTSNYVVDTLRPFEALDPLNGYKTNHRRT